MAIIVDKIQKRRDIALSCKEIFVLKGIKDLTISEIAKTAGIGKGTIYAYFKNKEDIVFEIVNILIQKRNEVVVDKLSKIKSTKDKLKYFSSFFYSEDDLELRELYKEFISIALTSPDKEMIEFQTKCFNEHFIWFEKIIQDAIDSGEIIKHSLKLTCGLFVTAQGMFISSTSTNAIENIESELNDYLDSVFELIEIKK
jgi:AcrR family transcriptional regulator